MKIFQSSLSYTTFEYIRRCRPDIKINLLRSYDNNNDETLKIIHDFKDNINSKILDSGVWSKYNDPINHNHTVEDYALFLKEHADKFDIYFNYDEDFKEIEKDDFSSKNRDNQKFLEDAGFSPVPVLHLLDDEEVKYYLDQKSKYPFVAIGSNSISDKRFAGVVKQFYDEKVKVHAFKMGSYKKLRDLHVYSSDCSSHARWTAVGRCIFFSHEEELKFIAACKARLGSKIKSNPKVTIEKTVAFNKYQKNGKQNKYYFQWNDFHEVFSKFLRKVANIEFNDLLNDSNARTYSNSIYYWWLERYLTLLHFDIGIDFEDDPFLNENLCSFKNALSFGEKSELDEFVDELISD